ncbi:DUF1707 domain-containing protein [Corynebacterium sp.]|uniref:DUF1707 SHOCT-like domain-containing protein n=1 Tax=Corynebacterium sp. TaxID=1720 RepID=UPI0026DD36A3|nr:DUF1707 domain-containing protein [Corynebacterium sp.]MDO5031084.1 DUF1707 domain-containing protein [Corynebacterium sp.]
MTNDNKKDIQAGVRAGNAERNAALDRLGVYFADGFLDVTEFEERTGKAAAARTREDLAKLFQDLPDLDEQDVSSQAVDVKAHEELQSLERRGALVNRFDAAFWGVALVITIVGPLALHWNFAWLSFVVAGVLSVIVRGVLKVNVQDELLYDELKSDKDEKRAERLRLAAQRRKELGQ